MLSTPPQPAANRAPSTCELVDISNGMAASITQALYGFKLQFHRECEDVKRHSVDVHFHFSSLA
jgi:hypothetical protein